MSLVETALFLAQHWPVFPCGKDKRPITAHGFKDATRDPDQIRELFRRPGAALIGVPTGEASDLAVIDLDVKDGAPGLEWLAANEHRLPRTRQHETRTGGRHLLFRYPAGRRIRNSVRGIAPGVDVRGAGGYIISAPSDGYTIADDAMPADMPRWLLDILDPPAAPPAPRDPYTRERIPERYIEAAVAAEVRAVASAPEGTRNDTLNRAAFALGQLVAAGGLPEGAARAELRAAALHAGLDPRETDLTIASGLAGGGQYPRQIPERERPARTEPRKAPVLDYDPETGEVIESPTQLKDGPAPFTLLWFSDIRPALDANDFVQGVLVENSAAVVYGESNAGKTFWATDLALHVAAGKPWNDRRVEQGGVVYCVLEGGIGFRNRVSAWRAAHKCPGPVHFAAIQSGMNLLQPEADTPRLIATIRQAAEHIGMPVKLIVIDTLSRAFAGGNENASEDMGLLVQNMDEIRRETGACVLFIHHSGKDQAKGARGHSLLRAAIDTEIEVKANEETGLKTATTVKQREVKKGETLTFTLEVIELGKNPHGEAVTTCIVRAAEAEAEETRHLPSGAKFGLAALHEALAKAGQRPVSRDIPEWARVVPMEAWRREFYARSHLDNQDAKKKAFQRAVKDLRDASLVGVMHDQAWLADRNAG